MKPRCMATMIGSMPHTDPHQAVRLVLSHLEQAPIWPELPRRSFLEGMVAAHTAGLPGLVLDEGAGKLHLDTGGDCSGPLAEFYQRALHAEDSGDLSAFAVAPAYASALRPAIAALREREVKYPCIKTHCIGPISFQLQLCDHSGRPLFYDQTFQDVLARQVALQSRWLVRCFAPLAQTVIAFLDEPSLAAFGSMGYIAVSREQVVERLGAVISALKAEGALVGVHVCGNTDWPMIIEAGADLLNYDAYDYGQSMLLYPREVGAFLGRGGILAWGIVPNSEKVRGETVGSLEERFGYLVDRLASAGVERELILSQSMLTPSCGLGSIGEEDALSVMVLLRALSRTVQARIGRQELRVT